MAAAAPAAYRGGHRSYKRVSVVSTAGNTIITNRHLLCVAGGLSMLLLVLRKERRWMGNGEGALADSSTAAHHRRVSCWGRRGRRRCGRNVRYVH